MSETMAVIDEDSVSTAAPGRPKIPAPKVTLIPWDPDSQQHVDRLYSQRVVCGWKSEEVHQWRALQRDGKMAINWIVS